MTEDTLDLATSGIIGQALRFMHLGPVARHDPGSELLPALREAFDSAIDDCLAAADWSFASTLVTLPPVSNPTEDGPLAASAVLPGDLILARQLWPLGSRWRVDGRLLRHDAPAQVTLRYTARVTRETALPATFKAAVALHIALRLAGRWAGSGADPEALADAAVLTLKQAMRDDASQASTSRWDDAPGSGLAYGSDADWAMEAVA